MGGPLVLLLAGGIPSGHLLLENSIMASASRPRQIQSSIERCSVTHPMHTFISMTLIQEPR